MPNDTPGDASPDQLLSHLEGALELLSDYDPGTSESTAAALPLPSLLEQCQELAAYDTPPTVRVLQHFACTGGTLLSKAITALPNTLLLSELDPLSELKIDANSQTFEPTDVIRSLRYAARPVSEKIISGTFQGALNALVKSVHQEGRHLILRVHSHSQFCTGTDPEARSTVLGIVESILPTRSLTTIRHPLDSYLSLGLRRWRSFHPPTLEEYAFRYVAFLERHATSPIVLYEDFIADPETTLQDICEHLNLRYSPLALNMLGAARVTGDSGRSSDVVAPRTRRPVPDEIEAQRDNSPTYIALCKRFGYEP